LCWRANYEKRKLLDADEHGQLPDFHGSLLAHSNPPRAMSNLKAFDGAGIVDRL
jgi:hypothetical protein